MAKCNTNFKVITRVPSSNFINPVPFLDAIDEDIPESLYNNLINSDFDPLGYHIRGWLTALDQPGYIAFPIDEFRLEGMRSFNLPAGKVAWSKINYPLKETHWPAILDLESVNRRNREHNKNYEPNSAVGKDAREASCPGCNSTFYCSFSSYSSQTGLSHIISRIHFSDILPSEIILPEFKTTYEPRKVSSAPAIYVKNEPYNLLHPIGIDLTSSVETDYNSSLRNDDAQLSWVAQLLWADADNEPRAWERIESMDEIFSHQRYIHEKSNTFLTLGLPANSGNYRLEDFSKALVRATLTQPALEL